MNPTTFEQISANATAVGDTKPWLKEQDVYIMTLWNGTPLTIEAPNTVTLKITETDPGIRGDTATGGTKPATLETGAVVRVPLFLEEGDVIEVDTRATTPILGNPPHDKKTYNHAQNYIKKSARFLLKKIY